MGARFLETDECSAAGDGQFGGEEFLSRRGLGKMKPIEIRDRWLQEEILKGQVEVRTRLT